MIGRKSYCVKRQVFCHKCRVTATAKRHNVERYLMTCHNNFQSTHRALPYVTFIICNLVTTLVVIPRIINDLGFRGLDVHN